LPVGSSAPAAAAVGTAGVAGVAGVAGAAGAGAFGVDAAADEVFDVLAFDDFASSTTPATERTLMVGETRAPLRPPQQTPGQPPIGPPAAQPRDFGPPLDDDQPPTPYQRSRRRGWIALFVVLLLAVGAALSGWWFAIGRFQPTPDVVDMSQSAAESKIEQAGLSFEIDQTAYSETVAPGHVISTEPGPGDDVLKDGTVSAVVSKGPERHDVPKLDSMSESEAIDAITEASLAVGDTTRKWSETVAEGQLISYSPKAGTSLKPDAEVTLVVSRGPKPIKISNYEGDSADSAESELESAGFDVKIKERYDDDIDSGVVISQKPGKGVGYKGDTITLTVSQGPPLAEVPDVTGAGVEAATEKLKDAGFKVQVVDADLYIGLGYIVSQNPEAGTMAAIGSTVTISQV
jgi:serine/threonine-protein kinase